MEHRSRDTIRKISRLGSAIIVLMLAFSVILCVIVVVVAVMGFTDTMVLPSGYTRDELVFRCSTGLTSCAVLIAVLYLLYRLTRNLSLEETPFVEDNVRVLKRISLILLVGFVLTTVLQAVLLHALSVPGQSFNIDLSPLISAVVVYVLALVFQYGLELQDESDSFL